MVEFNKEELEAIKSVMNVFNSIHKDYLGSSEANEIATGIWVKLEKAGVVNIEKDLDYEDTLEANLYEECDDCDEDSPDKVSLCHIGGYELLRDGTQTDTFDDIDDLRVFLDDNEIEYDEDIEDLQELADSIEDQWQERYDDGGGSGWIE